MNRPELLPPTPGESTFVIDVARILSERQESVIQRTSEELQAATGVKLRVLAQTYPTTPGLAIKKYWGIDSNTLVYVHDTGGLGENFVVNFNAGEKVEAMKPVTFWRQMQNRFGNRFYIQEHGDSDTIMDVVAALKEALAPANA